MREWQSVLKANPTDWLLAEDAPSVRYFVLTQLLDVPATDAVATAARNAIMQTGYVPALLALQNTDDYRAGYPHFYTQKYRGLVWSLIVLAELGATVNPAIAAQCEYLLSHSQEGSQGGFAQNTAVKTGGGRLSEVIPCLTGNMVWSLCTLGYGDDPRVQKGLDWLVSTMRYNDGLELDPQVAPYNHYEMCWGAHTCHMGVVKALKAYGAIPPQRRSAALGHAVEQAAEFMLAHHVDRRSHSLNRISKPGWRKFGFPLMYQTDTLEVLDVLTALGYRDARMDEAVQAVLAKQTDAGCWLQENAYASDRLLLPMEAAGEPGKWVTLRAMRVLKRYYS